MSISPISTCCSPLCPLFLRKPWFFRVKSILNKPAIACKGHGEIASQRWAHIVLLDILHDLFQIFRSTFLRATFSNKGCDGCNTIINKWVACIVKHHDTSKHRFGVTDFCKSLLDSVYPCHFLYLLDHLLTKLYWSQNFYRCSPAPYPWSDFLSTANLHREKTGAIRQVLDALTVVPRTFLDTPDDRRLKPQRHFDLNFIAPDD